MIGLIARKEFSELRRDARFRAAAFTLTLLFLAGGVFGWSNYLELAKQAQRASQDERERWTDQAHKHPHAGAHYGVFAFKSPRPLAILDSGIQPYVGASVWLEAHKQNEMLYRPAEDATALQRFGDLTVAMVGQSLLPLLIIFMGYSAFAGEREQGTLQQLIALGIPPLQLLLGKAAGLGYVLPIVLVPAFTLSMASAALLARDGLVADELARAGLFAACYTVYLGGFLFFTLAVSAWCRSSKSALVVLLTFWAVTVLAAPRVLSDWARIAFPIATTVELKHELEATLDETVSRTLKQRESQLLEQYRVTRLEDLPFDPTGLILQTDEEASYGPFEQHYGAFFDTLRAQNRFYQLGTLVSPVAGLQLASMAFAGTDLEQHRDFIRKAEDARRVIHTMINDYIAEHAARNANGEWEVEAGRELWERIPEFEYTPPGWETVLPHYGPGLGLLVLWLAGCVIAAFLAVSNLRAD
ncbi:MAG: DUF3526 domain-containing protein [Methylococcales bacterium]